MERSDIKEDGEDDDLDVKRNLDVAALHQGYLASFLLKQMEEQIRDSLGESYDPSKP